MSPNRSFRPLVVLSTMAALLVTLLMPGIATATDIAGEPLITMPNVTAKPNIMFILDSSGSMADSSMPDEQNGSDSYGYWSSQCNGLAYDPNTTYLPPVDSAKNSYPNSSFSSAPSNGYDSNNNKKDLKNSYYYTYSGSQPARSWAYGTNGKVITTTNFYKECQSNIGDDPGKAVFTKVTLTTAANNAVKTNYANWYSYYRTRMLLMQTAVGQAFSGLDDGYRIGFTTIGYKGITDNGTNPFRNVATFDTTQKSNFYQSLYAETPGGYTPLRGALSKVGRYYAKKITSQTYDPMEYACQRNYAILTTDGYWNNHDETSTYGPLAMSGSTNVGNTDWDEARPMYDGSSTVTTLTRTRYRVDTNNCSSSTTPYRLRTNVQTSNDGVTWNNGSSTTQCVSGTTVVNGSTAFALSGTTTYSAETSTTTPSGGSTNSLADVAEYYYKTDLRNANLWNNCTSNTSGSDRDVCADIVPTSGRDDKKNQHMTTFTIGLGVSGTLVYDKNYLSQDATTGGAYYDLTKGLVNWPVPPDTDNDGDARNIDDLWHAAVNGRGQYYSALNAAELKQAIEGVKNQIQEVTGAASAAVTNRLELVAGAGNIAFQASYVTAQWVGDVEAFELNSSTGALASTPTWSAKARLDAATPGSRNIKFNKGGVLADFTYANLPTAYAAYFDGLCSKSVLASQCSSLSTTPSGGELALANSGANLVDFLRGTPYAYYRTRLNRLGDIINSSPVYVGTPPFSYTDTGYGDYKTNNSGRASRVYAGANDGMLHAFDATTGDEVWAFVPTAVMPNLYKLADSSYGSRHAYFVDGAPVVGDVYDSATSSWKTILVGGLNAGGKSYFALDITNPNSPSLLWEFTDTNLGLSYGNPMIVKRSTGKWVVAFASGYNYSGGAGQEQLFVLDAISGTKEKVLLSTGLPGTSELSLTLGEGTSADPNGLAKINAWIADSTDNTVLRFYGGDLKGNLWRFDLDNIVQPNHSAFRLAQIQTSGGVAEPITIQPRLKLVSNQPVVMVGTGRYLGTNDITDTTMQSMVAVKDPLTSTGWGVVRNNAAIKQSTVTLTDPNVADPTTATAKLLDDNAAITAPNPPVNWATDGGWWFDLPLSGERVVAPMAVGGNKLLFASAIPSGDACTTGGASRLYLCDITTGNCTGELYSESSLIVGMTILTTDTGDLVALIRDSTGNTVVKSVGSGSNTGVGTARRTSWRELVD